MNFNETKITDLKNAYESIFKTQTELKDIMREISETINGFTRVVSNEPRLEIVQSVDKILNSVSSPSNNIKPKKTKNEEIIPPITPPVNSKLYSDPLIYNPLLNDTLLPLSEDKLIKDPLNYNFKRLKDLLVPGSIAKLTLSPDDFVYIYVNGAKFSTEEFVPALNIDFFYVSDILIRDINENTYESVRHTITVYNPNELEYVYSVDINAVVVQEVAHMKHSIKHLKKLINYIEKNRKKKSWLKDMLLRLRKTYFNLIKPKMNTSVTYDRYGAWNTPFS